MWKNEIQHLHIIISFRTALHCRVKVVSLAQAASALPLGMSWPWTAMGSLYMSAAARAAEETGVANCRQFAPMLNEKALHRARIFDSIRQWRNRNVHIQLLF